MASLHILSVEKIKELRNELNLKKVMNEHIKVYTDSAIVINRIVQLLEDNNIHSLKKDNVESARVAGFGTSYFNVDLYVYESDAERAGKIIKSFLDKE